MQSCRVVSTRTEETRLSCSDLPTCISSNSGSRLMSAVNTVTIATETAGGTPLPLPPVPGTAVPPPKLCRLVAIPTAISASPTPPSTR